MQQLASNHTTTCSASRAASASCSASAMHAYIQTRMHKQRRYARAQAGQQRVLLRHPLLQRRVHRHHRRVGQLRRRGGCAEPAWGLRVRVQTTYARQARNKERGRTIKINVLQNAQLVFVVVYFVLQQGAPLGMIPVRGFSKGAGSWETQQRF